MGKRKRDAAADGGEVIYGSAEATGGGSTATPDDALGRLVAERKLDGTVGHLNLGDGSEAISTMDGGICYMDLDAGDGSAATLGDGRMVLGSGASSKGISILDDDDPLRPGPDAVIEPPTYSMLNVEMDGSTIVFGPYSKPWWESTTTEAPVPSVYDIDPVTAIQKMLSSTPIDRILWWVVAH